MQDANRNATETPAAIAPSTKDPSSSASPSSSISNNDNASASSPSALQSNPKLLSALSNQLRYYFSPKNLSTDTYLNTIMQLNSGYVPVSILANFANVNKIIARFSTDAMDHVDVQSLLRKAVQASSNALEIVLLDLNGQVIDDDDDDDGKETKMKGGATPTFEGIGSSKGCKNDERKQKEFGQTHTTLKSATNATTTSTTATDNNKSSTVILRDVPEGATENDIRAIFQIHDDDQITSPTIINVQKEVGQCWFVTIDSSTSQQDLVSILLNLRTKRICDEPIKARLKTQSTATPSFIGPSMQGGGTSDSGNSSSYNPYRSRSYQGYNHHNDRHQVYSGDRVSYPRNKYNNHSSRPFSKTRGGRGSSTDGGKHDVGKKEKVGPPPPLIDEHFPGLMGGGVDCVSPTSTIVTGDHGSDAEGARSTDDGVKLASPAVLSVPNGGYAAALLKSAPPLPDVRLQQQPEKRVMSVKPKSPMRKKNEDAKSTATSSTEDSSSDDKSSLSSRADTESHIVATPVAGSAWGGGRSFADILKKDIDEE